MRAVDEPFLQREAILEQQRAGLARISGVIGNIRVLWAGLLLAVLIYGFVQTFSVMLAIALAVLAVIFVALWIIHMYYSVRLRRCEGLIAINRQYIQRIHGEWTTFAETGLDFLPQEHPYGDDLDIVGPKSLFQLLLTAHTWHGRQAFANDLLDSNYAAEQIGERQAAIEELSHKNEFSQEFQYDAKAVGADKEVLSLLDALRDRKLFIQSPVIKWLLTLCPMAVSLFTAAVCIFRLRAFYVPAFVCVAAQALVWAFGRLKIEAYLSSAGYMKGLLERYAKLFAHIQEENFVAGLLVTIQRQLAIDGDSAAKALQKLDGITQRQMIRNQGLIYFFCNVFLLWDYETAILLEKWKRQYAGLAAVWFEALGNFESLLCFANLPLVTENIHYPKILAKQKTISAKAIGHPLIPNGQRVYNDFDSTDEIVIISGSNMSGKTTFLRTVGINIVLARAGAGVCAGEMSLFQAKPVSSMRIRDDLNEGVSTFYAELKRIKAILELAETNGDILFLIDEIFRGTNSIDRLEGAKAVIKQLNRLKTAGLITTHDLELCRLSELPRIRNASFSEYYENKQIHFDYKLKSGPSTTTNAKFLMEMVGILKE